LLLLELPLSAPVWGVVEQEITPSAHSMASVNRRMEFPRAL
jgi:hypothetical protein